MSLRGALPGRKPGTVGVADQLAELLVEPVVDVAAVDGDLDVLLARPDVADLDRLVQLGGRVLMAGVVAVRVVALAALRPGPWWPPRSPSPPGCSSVICIAPTRSQESRASPKRRPSGFACSRPTRPQERVMGLEPTTATLATYPSIEKPGVFQGFWWQPYRFEYRFATIFATNLAPALTNLLHSKAVARRLGGYFDGPAAFYDLGSSPAPLGEDAPGAPLRHFVQGAGDAGDERRLLPGG